MRRVWGRFGGYPLRFSLKKYCTLQSASRLQVRYWHNDIIFHIPRSHRLKDSEHYALLDAVKILCYYVNSLSNLLEVCRVEQNPRPTSRMVGKYR